MLGVCQGVFFAMWLGTFSLSQMNDVELTRTLSWRENALFEERKKNVSVSQMSRVCFNAAMTRRRTFEEREKNVFGVCRTHLAVW